ncbi:hypothetical protein Q5424_25200 [Conexibacter sp. JD483]|uniref:hypothetical protein n=1 Tax=unclassified Conexibacter TaxID=2627773 RepID=UPI00272935C5|nr:MULTISPECIES: hypothetical protein [unclassified Conexibacter]MDO8186073.1 hypothetical protein [Conexibacter sp. CPCC 205706]MDO8199563.1 hypothetical protein [Conexibacter sp. CPCC 205762]MDR9372419.1 hypothetical protein [Conexibacter sp. JD483]
MPRIRSLLLALLLLAAAAPAADAARRSGVDRGTQVRLTLDGRVLTAKLVTPRSGAVFSHRWGEQRATRLFAACGTTFKPIEPSQRSRYAYARGRWPLDARRATFRLPRDISARASWCLLEGPDGGDYAFVSFHRAEPQRRIAGGRGDDGRAWSLTAGQGDHLAPCVELRAHGSGVGRCFEDQAEIDARLDWEFENATCKTGFFAYGVAPPATAQIALTYAGGRVETTAALAPPAGSKMRARLFATALTGGDAPVSIAALDAAGRTLETSKVPAGLCR